MTARLPLLLGSALLTGALAIPTAASTTAAAAPAAATAVAAGPPASVRDGCLTSVPDPGTNDPVAICWTL